MISVDRLKEEVAKAAKAVSKLPNILQWKGSKNISLEKSCLEALLEFENALDDEWPNDIEWSVEHLLCFTPLSRALVSINSVDTEKIYSKKLAKFSNLQCKLLLHLSLAAARPSFIYSKHPDFILGARHVPTQTSITIFKATTLGLVFFRSKAGSQLLSRYASQPTGGFSCPAGEDMAQEDAIQSFNQEMISQISLLQAMADTEYLIRKAGDAGTFSRQENASLNEIYWPLSFHHIVEVSFSEFSVSVSKSFSGNLPPLDLKFWPRFFRIMDKFCHVTKPKSSKKEDIMPSKPQEIAMGLIQSEALVPILKESLTVLPAVDSAEKGKEDLSVLGWAAIWPGLITIALYDPFDFSCCRAARSLFAGRKQKLQNQAELLSSQPVQAGIRSAINFLESIVEKDGHFMRRVQALLGMWSLKTLTTGQFCTYGEQNFRLHPDYLKQLAVATAAYVEFAEVALKAEEAAPGCLKPLLGQISVAIKAFTHNYSFLAQNLDPRQVMAESACPQRATAAGEASFANSTNIALLKLVSHMGAAHAVLSPLKSKFNRVGLGLLVAPALCFPLHEVVFLIPALNIQGAEDVHPVGSPVLKQQIGAAAELVQITCKDALIHLSMSREEIGASYTHGFDVTSRRATEGAITTHLFMPALYSLGIASKYLLEDSTGAAIYDAPVRQRRTGTALLLQALKMAAHCPVYWNDVIRHESLISDGPFRDLYNQIVMYVEVVPDVIPAGGDPGIEIAQYICTLRMLAGRENNTFADCLSTLQEELQVPRNQEAVLKERALVLGSLQCSNLNCKRVVKPWAATKSKKCGGCEVVCYCCAACQKEDWKEHKKVCKLFREK